MRRGEYSNKGFRYKRPGESSKSQKSSKNQAPKPGRSSVFPRGPTATLKIEFLENSKPSASLPRRLRILKMSLLYLRRHCSFRSIYSARVRTIVTVRE